MHIEGFSHLRGAQRWVMNLVPALFHALNYFPLFAILIKTACCGSSSDPYCAWPHTLKYDLIVYALKKVDALMADLTHWQKARVILVNAQRDKGDILLIKLMAG